MAIKKTKIIDFMPKQETTILVQAKIRSDLHHKVKEKLKANNNSIQELVNAAFEKYLAETLAD